jgi:hypothetical protein
LFEDNFSVTSQDLFTLLTVMAEDELRCLFTTVPKKPLEHIMESPLLFGFDLAVVDVQMLLEETADVVAMIA